MMRFFRGNIVIFRRKSLTKADDILGFPCRFVAVYGKIVWSSAFQSGVMKWRIGAMEGRTGGTKG